MLERWAQLWAGEPEWGLASAEEAVRRNQGERPYPSALEACLQCRRPVGRFRLSSERFRRPCYGSDPCAAWRAGLRENRVAAGLPHCSRRKPPCSFSVYRKISRCYTNFRFCALEASSGYPGPAQLFRCWDSAKESLRKLPERESRLFDRNRSFGSPGSRRTQFGTSRWERYRCLGSDRPPV